MLPAYNDFIIGIVAQSPDLLQEPGLLQLTPGVKLNELVDELGQTYDTPQRVVVGKGADIAVVGRGIIQAKDVVKAAKNYQEQLWAAYLSRIKP